MIELLNVIVELEFNSTSVPSTSVKWNFFPAGTYNVYFSSPLPILSDAMKLILSESTLTNSP